MDEETHPIIERKKSGFVFKSTTCVLAIALTLAIAALIVIAITFAVTAVLLNQRQTTDDNVCLTEDCVTLAALVLSNMNQSVDPCQDFYNFTCGSWDQQNIIPPGSGRYSTFDQLAERNTIALIKILDEGRGSEVEAVKKAIDLYQTCLDVDTIDDKGATPLLDLINKTGGWSLIDGNSTWNINGSSFLDEKLAGSPAFFALGVDIDDKDSNNYILSVIQSGLSLPSAANYFDNKTSAEKLDALKTLITTVFTLLVPTGDSNDFEDVVDDIVKFETSLAGIFISNVELRNIDKTYNKMTVADLHSLWPDYDWVTGATNLFAKVNVTIDGSEPILVRTPTYLQNLTAIFRSASNNTLENYAKWQLVMQYLPEMSDAFLAALSTFNSIVSGTGSQPRYKKCIGTVQSIMPIALSRPYSEYILPKDTKDEVSKVVENIKTAFKQRLDNSDWLDDTTKEKSKEKVDAITKMVAYPDNVFNDTYLNDFYSDYDVEVGDHFGNILRSVELENLQSLGQLRDPVDKTQWLNAPTAVNAYYSPQFNQFVFLEGILNTPFFQAGWPEYFQYGALGVVVGHELTHGFDDQGQRYNKDGILTPWWTNASVEEFKKRQECFVDQYSEYELYGYKINGSLTLGENIADNGGVKASYTAYQNELSKSKQTPPSLPAVKYSPDQLYFIAFGQVWCSLFSPEYLSVSTEVDPHSPGPFRIIGSLVNSPEFAEAFKCDKDTRMNPTDKCLMW